MGNLLNMGIKMQDIATTTTTTTAVTVYTYLGRSTPDAASSAIACSTYATVRGYQSLRSTLASIIVGDVMYDTYPTPTNGGDNWIALKSGGVGDAYSFQINSSGVVTSVGGNCNTSTTTTTTTSVTAPVIIVNFYDDAGGYTDLYKNGAVIASVPANTGDNTYSGYVAGDTVKVEAGLGNANTIEYYLNGTLINTYSNFSGAVSTPNITVSNGNTYRFNTFTILI